MDDTAQTSSVQKPLQPVLQTTTSVSDVQQTPPPPVVAPQPVTRPVEPPQGGRGPEQGPARSGPPQREAAPIDEADAVPPAASDDSSDVIDDPDSGAAKVVEVQSPVEAQPEQAIEVQESHPQVELPQELTAVGVEPGPDSQKDQLPEEKQEIVDEEPAVQ